MAVLSASDRARVARLWCRFVYRAVGGGTAVLNQADALAAVSSIDDSWEGLPNALPNPGTASVAQNFNSLLPLPFRTIATTEEKGTMLEIFFRVKYNSNEMGGT